MNECNSNCTAGSAGDRWLAEAAPRFPDLRHRFRVRWKDALSALLGPAERLHQLRNLRSAMFYDAVNQVDRRDDCN